MASTASNDEDQQHNIELGAIEEGRGLLEHDANSAAVFPSVNTADNNSSNTVETHVQLPPVSPDVQRELERQAEHLIDNATEDELVLIYKEIEKWRIQVQVWSVALLITGIISVLLSFISVELLEDDDDDNDDGPRSYFFYFSFTIASKVRILIQLGILKLIPALISIITSFAGIIAAWKRQLHMARLYFTGLILLISTNIVLLLFSLITMNLERIQIFDFVMVSFIMAIILVCGVSFGLLFNSPCLCCLYCGRQYQYALWDLHDYENPQNPEGDDDDENNDDEDTARTSSRRNVLATAATA